MGTEGQAPRRSVPAAYRGNVDALDAIALLTASRSGQGRARTERGEQLGVGGGDEERDAEIPISIPVSMILYCNTTFRSPCRSIA